MFPVYIIKKTVVCLWVFIVRKVTATKVKADELRKSTWGMKLQSGRIFPLLSAPWFILRGYEGDIGLEQEEMSFRLDGEHGGQKEQLEEIKVGGIMFWEQII